MNPWSKSKIRLFSKIAVNELVISAPEVFMLFITPMCHLCSQPLGVPVLPWGERKPGRKSAWSTEPSFMSLAFMGCTFLENECVYLGHPFLVECSRRSVLNTCQPRGRT